MAHGSVFPDVYEDVTESGLMKQKSDGECGTQLQYRYNEVHSYVAQY